MELVLTGMIPPQKLQKVAELIRKQIRETKPNIGASLDFKSNIRQPLEAAGVSWGDIVDTVRYLQGIDILQIDRDEYDSGNLIITPKTYDWVMNEPQREPKKGRIGFQP